MEHIGRKILHSKHTRKQELRGKYDLAFRGCLCVKMQFNLKIRWRQIAGIDVDRNIDVGLALLGR